jgi:lipoprotein NlpI
VKSPAIFLFLLFMASCSNRNGVPNNIIAPDSMANIMKDVILAESYSSQYVLKDSLKKDKVKANQDLLEDIFKLHHISRTDFKNSLAFYESRPDLNKKIFDSLNTDQARHRNDLYAPQVKPKPFPLHPK